MEFYKENCKKEQNFWVRKVSGKPHKWTALRWDQPCPGTEVGYKTWSSLRGDFWYNKLVSDFQFFFFLTNGIDYKFLVAACNRTYFNLRDVYLRDTDQVYKDKRSKSCHRWSMPPMHALSYTHTCAHALSLMCSPCLTAAGVICSFHAWKRHIW